MGISSKINSSRDNSFYYPSQVTPISATMSLSGTIFEYPKKSYSKSSNPKYAFNLAKPDELKTDSQLQKEAEELEKKLKAEAEKKAAEDLLENGDVVEETEIIQEVVIEDNAVINGTLKYPEEAEAKVSESATVANVKTYKGDKHVAIPVIVIFLSS